MKTARKLPSVTKRFYRPEQSLCFACQSHLRRAVTLSERTVITLQGAIKVVSVFSHRVRWLKAIPGSQKWPSAGRKH
jgi:hypothetical protein